MRTLLPATLTVVCLHCCAHLFDFPPTKPTFPLHEAIAKAEGVIGNSAFRCKSATWAGVNLGDNPTPERGGLWRLTFTDGTQGRLIEVNWDGTMRVPSPYSDSTVLPEQTAIAANRLVQEYLGEQSDVFVYVIWTYGRCWNVRLWDMKKHCSFFLYVHQGQVLTESQIKRRLQDRKESASEAPQRSGNPARGSPCGQL